MTDIEDITLKKIVGPSTRVIIWVTEENFNKTNDLFNDLNYFFDGLFSEREADLSELKNQTSLFTTKSFGEDLFLFRLHPEKINTAIDEIKKKAQENMNSHTVLAVDTGLESSYYKISKEFEGIANLEIHLSKDLIERL